MCLKYELDEIMKCKPARSGGYVADIAELKETLRSMLRSRT